MSKFYQKTEKQVKYWTYAAGSLPFAALAAIFFSWFIGYNTLTEKLLVLTATGFFATSVFWWWWALHKFLYVLKNIKAASEGLQAIKASIQDFKKYLKDSDDSNR